MTNNILTNYSDDKFRLRAFKDYCEARQKNYSELIQMTSEAVELVPDLDESTTLPDDAVIAQIVDQVLNNHPNQLPDKSVLFDQGYSSIRDMLTLAVQETMSNVDGEHSINLINAAGTAVSSLQFNEMVDQMKTNLHAMTVLVASNAAILEGSIADKVTIFNDKLKELFENSYSDLSNTALYYKEVLLSQTSVQSYFSALATVMDVENIQKDNSISVPANSQINQFTGATPLTGLVSGMSKGFGIINGVINAGVKAVGGLLKGVVSIGKKAFSWMGKKLNQIVANPYDIEVVNSEAESYTIDGWSYNNTSLNMTEIRFQNWFDRNGNSNDNYIDLETLGNLVARLNEHTNKWIKFSNKGAEFIVKYSSVTIENANWGYPDYDRLVIFHNAEFCYKPKSLDYNTVFNIVRSLQSKVVKDQGPDSGTLKISDYVKAFSDLQQASTLYADTSSDERYLFKSFMAGFYMDDLASQAALSEVKGRTILNYNVHQDLFFYVEGVTGHTNADFVAMASGWDFSTDNPSFKDDVYYKNSDGVVSHGLFSPSLIMSRFLMVYAYNLQEQFMHPFDYPFLPYREDKEGLSESRFGIKTDATNMGAFEKFIEAVTVVIIVAAVATTAVIVAKKITRKLYYKAMQKQSVLNQKMWNGEQLTDAEKRSYRRATRRLEKSNYISSGMQSGASSSSHTVNDNNNLTIADVYNVIRG